MKLDCLPDNDPQTLLCRLICQRVPLKEVGSRFDWDTITTQKVREYLIKVLDINIPVLTQLEVLDLMPESHNRATLPCKSESNRLNRASLGSQPLL